MEEAKIFKGRFVCMKLHDLEDDTWMLCRTDTGEPLVIGTREQILTEYDETEETGVIKNYKK